MPSGQVWESSSRQTFTDIYAQGGTQVAFEVRAVTGEGTDAAMVFSGHNHLANTANVARVSESRHSSSYSVTVSVASNRRPRGGACHSRSCGDMCGRQRVREVPVATWRRAGQRARGRSASAMTDTPRRACRSPTARLGVRQRALPHPSAVGGGPQGRPLGASRVGAPVRGARAVLAVLGGGAYDRGGAGAGGQSGAGGACARKSPWMSHDPCEIGPTSTDNALSRRASVVSMAATSITAAPAPMAPLSSCPCGLLVFGRVRAARAPELHPCALRPTPVQRSASAGAATRRACRR